MPERVVVEGRTAGRIVRADRVRFLVDAEAYFRTLRRAAAAARRQILVLGWDVDSRLRLVRDDEAHDLPVRLGPFLDALVRRREALEVRLLTWDPAFIYAFEREFLVEARLGWLTHPRLHFHLDDAHPPGASHHQKVVVLDDRMAFLGGLDLASRRWDTRGHAPEDPRRTGPLGAAYGPTHDLQAAVSGEAARALGELARARWRRATGETVEAPTGEAGDPWAGDLAPDLEDVEAGLVRTDPQDGARETRAFLLAAIASAKDHVYVENQYLTSKDVRDALAARLAEANGPEVILVLPRRPSGWLEESTMGMLLGGVLERLREADREGRLRVLYPVAADGTPIYVHAKVLEVDGRLLYVGSANLANRSMALDTEVGLAFEAGDRGDVAGAIARLRDGLLAEHLGVDRDRFAEGRSAEGSLVRAVDALRGEPPTLDILDGAGESEPLLPHDVVDPDGPLALPGLLERLGVLDWLEDGPLSRLLDRTQVERLLGGGGARPGAPEPPAGGPGRRDDG